MRLSFIVTPGARGLSDACVDSLLAAALPGDEVVAVAARDLPLATIAGRGLIVRRGPEARKGGGQPDAVTWRAVRLGAQPRPGAGVIANAGLSLAMGEAVVFLAGDARLVPAGVQAARTLLAQTAADIVMARFSGAYAGDEAAAWQRPDRDAALMMEAQPGRMMLRRSFLKASRLRHAEHLRAVASQAFHWHACLRAGEIGFHDGDMLRASETEEAAEPEARSAVFALHRELYAALGQDGPHSALCRWLARQVGRDLAALPPEDYWRYVEAADPTLLGGDWPDGRGGRALAALAARPQWQAVALLQGEAIWRALPGDPGQELSGFPPEDPQPHAVSRAIALWRGLRAGSAGGFGSDWA